MDMKVGHTYISNLFVNVGLFCGGKKKEIREDMQVIPRVDFQTLYCMES